MWDVPEFSIASIQLVDWNHFSITIDNYFCEERCIFIMKFLILGKLAFQALDALLCNATVIGMLGFSCVKGRSRQ